MNRLQHETSPYLRQHADNPVDWYPWGEEAFAAAKAADKPILLSVGYSACHWCHVMAHESFEDEATAKIMNDLFINVKVDREERPDVDDIYMQAVQGLTGHGGWPMTVFLMPDGRPFYGGTYFPPTPRMGMPSFRQVMEGVIDAFTQRRAEVDAAAGQITQALDRDTLGIGGTSESLNADLLDRAFKQITTAFDARYGGFGDAPKFPQPMNLAFLLRQYHRTGTQEALDMVLVTLRKMAQGGIYDQLGGGFHRYSVDAQWLVPHFEKMLYDNALLSRVYLHAWQITGDVFFRQIAEEVYDYVLREMTHPDGGFYSATDADSEGEEGKFFVWSKAEIEELLLEDAPVAFAYWGVTEGGNFEGTNILFRPRSDEAVAEELGLSVEALRERVAVVKDLLFAHRSQRIEPALDDKIITAWNGMMLASLAEGARVLGRPDYLVAAQRNAQFLTQNLMPESGRLLRTHKDGDSRIEGYLEDYANMIDGLLSLYQSDFDPQWFTMARALADTVLDHFAAPDGGFFDTHDDAEALIVRPRNVQDNATPSGSALIAGQFIRLSAYTGDARYDEAARSTLRLLSEAMPQVPQAFSESLCAVSLLVSGVDEIALVGDPATSEMTALFDVLRVPYRPNIIVALTETDLDSDDHAVPLLHFRTQRNAQPTAYVCRNFACQMPVTTPDALTELL